MNILKVILVLLLSGTSCVNSEGAQELSGSWFMQSDLPIYYQFSDDGKFLVNIVNPQTRRVMVVHVGSYTVNGDELTLTPDGASEVLKQSVEINDVDMIWIPNSKIEGYDETVSLKRIDIKLHTLEAFMNDPYNIYMK